MCDKKRTIPETRVQLWEIHDSLVEQGEHYIACEIVTTIALLETGLIEPDFMHRRVDDASS